MAEKPISSYLLKLATDASEMRRFMQGGDAARSSMSAAGLTDHDQQTMLLSHDQQAIQNAVAAEMEPVDLPAGAQAMQITFMGNIVRMIEPPNEP